LRKLKIKDMTKYYNPDKRSALVMQFGNLVRALKIKYIPTKKVDKRFKKHKSHE
tara:strand:- start:1636 stop:1797 length:162 start_codon:yes stop_codon:yes gene_type:complete